MHVEYKPVLCKLIVGISRVSNFKFEEIFLIKIPNKTILVTIWLTKQNGVNAMPSPFLEAVNYSVTQA